MVSKEHLKELESTFSQNEKHGNLLVPSHNFTKGLGNIILTAPHTVITSKIKNGIETIKENESYTGAITLMCGEIAGCHTMTRNNYNDVTAITNFYNEYLQDYISSYGIVGHLDIHGAARTNPYDVSIGTNHLEHIFYDQQVYEIVNDGFNDYGINNVVWNSKFQASTKATLCRQVFLGKMIHTLQLEINKNYRDLNDFEKMVALIKAISEIAINLNEHLSSGGLGYGR